MAKKRRLYKPMRIIVQKGIESGKREAIISIILSVFALLLYPPYLGLGALVLGIISYKKGQKGLGTFAIIMAIMFAIIGMILSILAYSSYEGGEMLDEEINAYGGIILLGL